MRSQLPDDEETQNSDNSEVTDNQNTIEDPVIQMESIDSNTYPDKIDFTKFL